MIDSLETKVALLNNNHEMMMDKLNEFQIENKEQHKELKEMIEKALESKAGKWVETAFTWFLYTVAGIIVSIAMYLIIKFGGKL